MMQEAVVVVLIYCLVGTHSRPLLLKTKKTKKTIQPGKEGREAKKGKKLVIQKTHVFNQHQCDATN